MATLKRHTSRSKIALPSFERKKVVIGVSLLILFIATFFLARINSLYSNISTRGESWGIPIPREKKVFSLLVMGYGGPAHDGAYLTDTMMFASVDTEYKRVLVVSIPRDIWARMPTRSGDEFAAKINSVYQTGLFPNNYPDIPKKYTGEHGASELVRTVVGDIVGQPVDNYIAIDFDGFKQIVDTLGGVQVDVKRPFSDPLYPIDGKEDDLCGLPEGDLEAFEEKEKIATESPELAYPCRYEVLEFAAGEQTMDGDTALKFVRSRHSPQDGGDFNRASRQQLFLEAIRDRVLSIGFIPKILPLMKDLENNVRTDMPIELIQRFMKEAPHISDYKVTQIVLTTDNYIENAISGDGQYILTSQDGDFVWRKLHRDVKTYLQGKTPMTPTPTSIVAE